MLGAESGAVISSCGDADDQFIGVGFGRFFQPAVFFRAFVSVNFQFVIVSAFYPSLLVVSNKFGIYHIPFWDPVTRGLVLFCTSIKRSTGSKPMLYNAVRFLSLTVITVFTLLNHLVHFDMVILETPIKSAISLTIIPLLRNSFARAL